MMYIKKSLMKWIWENVPDIFSISLFFAGRVLAFSFMYRSPDKEHWTLFTFSCGKHIENGKIYKLRIIDIQPKYFVEEDN